MSQESLTAPKPVIVQPIGVYDRDGRRLSGTVTLAAELHGQRRMEPKYEGVVQAWIHGQLVGVFEDGWDASERFAVESP